MFRQMLVHTFVAALFTIAENVCPPVDEQIQDVWSICAVEHHSAIKQTKRGLRLQRG